VPDQLYAVIYQPFVIKLPQTVQLPFGADLSNFAVSNYQIRLNHTPLNKKAG